MADESEEEENRKHCQRISRHAFDKSDADKKEPVRGHPRRVDRSKLEPARDGADKTECSKNDFLGPNYFGFVGIPLQIPEGFHNPVPGPREGHVKQLAS